MKACRQKSLKGSLRANASILQTEACLSTTIHWPSQQRAFLRKEAASRTTMMREERGARHGL